MDDQRANREGGGIRFRMLRIAWSVGWGIACLVLIMLWVQDYRDTRLISSLPFAFPTLISFGLTVAPWASNSTRFSLGTLLTAITLIAVVMGLMAYAMRL
jgi:hypothetical protein